MEQGQVELVHDSTPPSGSPINPSNRHIRREMIRVDRMRLQGSIGTFEAIRVVRSYRINDERTFPDLCKFRFHLSWQSFCPAFNELAQLEGCGPDLRDGIVARGHGSSLPLSPQESGRPSVPKEGELAGGVGETVPVLAEIKEDWGGDIPW